jgi:aspartate aminotransferase
VPISSDIKDAMTRGSFIRKMFEEGAALKKEHGADKVFDLSIGNPVMEPPPAFFDALAELSRRRSDGLHRYMPNDGYPHVKERIAAKLRDDGVFAAGPGDIVMTVGAAGGMNTVLKTIVDPGDEILILSPYFVEYIFYARNHNATPVFAETAEDFNLDLGEIEKKLSPKTKGLIINSPNNPTGRIYPRETLEGLAGLLMAKQKEWGTSIYVIADEPYREIVFVDDPPPSIVSLYPNSFMVYSWSKSLSIPGERIGFIAAHPEIDDPDVRGGLTFSNRVLGFVNAPAAMQHIAGQLLDETVDVNDYRAKRDRLVAGLREAGYDLVVPEGTFYVFPRSPLEDDVEFTRRAQEELVLVVPGSGFGRPGFFRIAFCVDDAAVDGGLAALQRTMKKL